MDTRRRHACLPVSRGTLFSEEFGGKGERYLIILDESREKALSSQQ